jgi:putative phosphoesterase
MPRGARRLPPRCIELIAGANAVIHAGDFVASSVLEEIEALGPPVHAVHGNVDEPALRQRLPATLELDLGGVRVAVVHDAGPRTGRAERLRARFPDADCAIFGHTHLPEHSRVGAFHAFNPGSPTERRRAPTRSMGVLELRGGEPWFRHVALPPHP